MRKLLTLILFIFCINIKGYSQTDGINYQAVIIDPDPEEIPGIDVTGNILPNKEIKVRFSISDVSGNLDFQEIHTIHRNP